MIVGGGGDGEDLARAVVNRLRAGGLTAALFGFIDWLNVPGGSVWTAISSSSRLSLTGEDVD